MCGDVQGKAGKFPGASLTIHPFLFVIYPPVFILSNNYDSLTPIGAMVILGIFALTAATVWIGFGYLWNWDMRKSGVLASASSIMLLAYVQIYIDTNGIVIAGFEVNRHRFLLPIGAILFLASAYAVSRAKRILEVVNPLLNITGLTLVILALIPIAEEKLRAPGVTKNIGCFASQVLNAGVETPDRSNGPASHQNVAGLPDIYYIIVDGHARSDILRGYYAYNNAPFLEALTKRGFYIADESNANYCQTNLSLASSLNGCYLDPNLFRARSANSCRAALSRMIRNNSAADALRKAGYAFVSFSSGFDATEIPRADVYIAPSVFPIFSEVAFIAALPVGGLFYALDSHFVFRIQYERLLYTFEKLGSVGGREVPRFIFCHMLAPHPPFVFGPKGEFRSYGTSDPLGDGTSFHRMQPRLQKAYAERYRDQTAFVETKMIEAVDKILERSPTAIVIIQADHGPAMLSDPHNLSKSQFKERMAILNAYLFPRSWQKLLYNRISPVNSFRLLCNRLLHLNVELLDDRSYFSSREDPMRFRDVTQEIANDSRESLYHDFTTGEARLRLY